MAARTAVAMSGGGHRASVFALGVALYLAEAGRAGQITSVSSVSGGSFANGALAQDVDLTTCSPSDVEATVARVSRKIARGGTVLAAPIARIYVAALVLLFLAVLVGTWFLPIAIGLRVLVFVVGVFVFAWFFGLIGKVTARALGHTLFSPDGSATRLSDVHKEVDHVMCATDLHAGEHVYFSGRFVGAYRFGIGTPGDLPLYSAVQASAAFPGVFPVAWLRTSRFGFKGGQPEAAGTRSLALHDGGVYDNMGDQWGQGLARRARDWAKLGTELKLADELVVVSASAGLEFGKVGKLGVPLFGFLLTLLRDEAVLYDNGNSVRREELVARFDLAEREGEGLRGALVHILQSPFRVADGFAGSTAWPARAAAAQEALELLLAGAPDPDAVRREWAQIAKENALVATTLLALGPDVTARLLYHSYVLAMVNLHVILGYPLLDVPTLERFRAMVA
jgi:predicted acylesterase/phospholipase RssA